LIRTKFFKFLTFLLLFAFTAGCIDPDVTDKIPVSGLNSEDLVTNIHDLIPDEVNISMPVETGLGEQNKIKENESTGDSANSISPEIPEIPTYPEEKSNIVYPKEYRRLSLNFQRGIGSGNERIASEVFNITGKTSGYDIKDACDVFDYVNRHWKYRYEDNADFFFGASQTINEDYNGDCDDYSIVMSALLKNMGFNTRIVTATNETYGHAYPELYIGSSKETAYEILKYVQGRYSYAENIWYSNRELKDGKLQYWLNFDWSGSNGYRHPGGVYFEGVQVIYYPAGLIEL
jgi:transglutaminase-like putative cysteine protease